jgi:DNA-binding response OmpR family regulator
MSSHAPENSSKPLSATERGTAPHGAPPAAARSAHVLVVEDEQALALGVRDALVHDGLQAQVCHDGPAALRMAQSSPFDLIVLDLMLPGLSGFDVLKKLREADNRTRVLILTALHDEDSVLKAFELGADDYVPKPFSPRELLARVNAQLRRQSQQAMAQAMLELPGGIKVDLQRLEAHRGGQLIALTPREGDILAYLIAHRDKVVTREDLLLDVWHYRNPRVATRTVDIHIVGLRRKVEPDPANPTLIQTVRGKGYRWFS